MAVKYCIVQHSGFGYAGDPQFTQGLEMRHVKLTAQVERVKAAGGIVFDSYKEADEYCDAEMYPPKLEGLIPRAPGTFSKHKVDGLAIYVPKEE